MEVDLFVISYVSRIFTFNIIIEKLTHPRSSFGKKMKQRKNVNKQTKNLNDNDEKQIRVS